MASFAKGDVVLFPFPYTDLNDRKIRPCLVISDEMRNDIILCQITSQSISKDKFCVEIKKDKTLDGSLMVDSFIRVNMIFTASRSQIIKKICRINNSGYKEVVRMINKIIS